MIHTSKLFYAESNMQNIVALIINEGNAGYAQNDQQGQQTTMNHNVPYAPRYSVIDQNKLLASEALDFHQPSVQYDRDFPYDPRLVNPHAYVFAPEPGLPSPTTYGANAFDTPAVTSVSPTQYTYLNTSQSTLPTGQWTSDG
ncbi:MAG: hypothetical protein Q9170_000651 [Blastenia crenularia]